MKKENKQISKNISKKEFENLLVSSGLIHIFKGAKGIIWKPYGLAMMNRYMCFLRKLIPKFSIEEYFFPLLVDKRYLDKLNNEIYNFDKGVYKTVDTVLRPSGEISIYPVFKDIIKSVSDLPLKVFQISSSFRYGYKAGIFRTNEVDFFVEGHTAHASREEVEMQVKDNDLLINQVLVYFGLPVIKTERPLWTNKPVAEKSYGYDAILPNGETLLVASNYEQMQVFSKVFNVGFIDKYKQYTNTFQSSFGFSFRPLMILLWQLCDQHGLRLLPSLAPIKVSIIEINPDNDINVASLIDNIKQKLQNLNINFIHDNNSKLSLSKRSSKYELQGVPIRIEIGKKEIDSGFIKLMRRDNFLFEESSLDNFNNVVNKLLNNIEADLRASLQNIFLDFQVYTGSSLDIINILKKNKVAKFSICFNRSCIDGLQASVGLGEVLGTSEQVNNGKCIVCKKNTKYIGWYSRRV